jgi:hypothetical protein
MWLKTSFSTSKPSRPSVRSTVLCREAKSALSRTRFCAVGLILRRLCFWVSSWISGWSQALHMLQMLGRRIPLTDMMPLDEPPIVHAGDTAGRMEDADFVHHDQSRKLLAAGDVFEELHHDMATVRVQRRSRPVADDEMRPVHPRTSYSDALLRPAGYLRGPGLAARSTPGTCTTTWSRCMDTGARTNRCCAP